MARNSGKKIKSARRSRYVAPRKTAAIADSNSDDAVPLRETIRLLMSNRSGFVGVILSVLQLLGHATWILLMYYLVTNNQAQRLTPDSVEAWLIVIILGTSLLLTAAALFTCLYYGLRQQPRSLAVIGFFLSFFVGVLASALVFLTGIRAMIP